MCCGVINVKHKWNNSGWLVSTWPGGSSEAALRAAVAPTWSANIMREEITMFSIKKFKADEVILEVNLGSGRTLKWTAGRSNKWVIMKDDQPYFIQNPLTGKPEMDMYRQKSTAQNQAEWLNEQEINKAA
jgi:hypothetical protein